MDHNARLTERLVLYRTDTSAHGKKYNMVKLIMQFLLTTYEEVHTFINLKNKYPSFINVL